MIELKREEFKTDPVLRRLFEFLKAHHKVANHTEKVLRENKHVKDFCEEARHFVQLGDHKPVYLHYDVATWWKDPDGVQVKFESIGIYDTHYEYETARLRELNSAKNADDVSRN